MTASSAIIPSTEADRPVVEDVAKLNFGRFVEALFSVFGYIIFYFVGLAFAGSLIEKTEFDPTSS